MSQQSEPPTEPVGKTAPPKGGTRQRIAGRVQKGVQRFFASLAWASIAYPKTAFGLVLLLVLLSAPGLWRLRLNTDGHALVTPTAPEVVYDKQVRAKFGIEDQIVVLIYSPASVLKPDTLQVVRELTGEFLKLPGIRSEHVMSLATEPSFRIRPGTLIHETMLERSLKSERELTQLQEDLRRIQLYTSTVISPDEKATVILVGVPPGSDRAKLYQQVREVIKTLYFKLETLGNDKASNSKLERSGNDFIISVTGAPVAESLLGIHILEDLGMPKGLLGTSTRSEKEQADWKAPKSFYELRLLIARKAGLVPVAISVMMMIFLVSFRSVVAMLLPLPGAGATILFVFGLMGWCGVPVYLTIAVMPVLLTATGVTNDIYLFSRYFTLLRERSNANRQEILRETFAMMANPVAATSLTAAIGFFSFAFSPLAPVRAFGIFTGIGILFGLFFSFTAVPAMLAMLAMLKVQSPKSKVQSPKFGLGARLAEFGAWMMTRRWWVMGVVLLMMALTPLGLRKLRVQDSWTDAFDPDSEFRRTTRLVNEEFYGMHLLFVSFDAPEVLKGQLPGSAVLRDGLLLPASLVGQPGLIAGSTVTVRKNPDSKLQAQEKPQASSSKLPRSDKDQINSQPAKAGTPNGGAKTSGEWVSHIEMVYAVGTNVGTRMPPKDISENVWAELAKEEKVGFEILIRSQVKPEIIKEISALGSFIRQRKQYAVGGVLSPFDYLSTTRFMARPNDPSARVLPDDPGEIKLMWDYYGLARGRERLHQIVDTNYWESLTTVFLKDANFVDTAKLMSDIRAYEREHLTSKGIKLGFAGDVALSQSLIHGIVSTQMQSLIWSLLGIFLVTSLLGGSLRWGLYCVLPSVLAIVIKFAVMGWTGIPLGVATSMFAAMTLGIGVNCAIQLLSAYNAAVAEGSGSSEAMRKAMRLSGPAGVINTVAVSVGFGVLMLSQVPANARLGFLVVLGLAGCLVLTLMVLPAALTQTREKANTQRPDERP